MDGRVRGQEEREIADGGVDGAVKAGGEEQRVHVGQAVAVQHALHVVAAGVEHGGDLRQHGGHVPAGHEHLVHQVRLAATVPCGWGRAG
jgi:hypothetical protein